MSASLRLSLSLQRIASDLEDRLAETAGERIPFVLVLQADLVAQYISNASRSDGVQLIEDLLLRWRAKRADIPAHYNPDLRQQPSDDADQLRALLRQAMEALDYHREQTRPIERTEEVLKALRASFGLCTKCGLPPGCPDCRAIHDVPEGS